MMAFLFLIVTLAALALTAFCAGAETGFLSVRRGRILHMARAGGARAKVILPALVNLGRTTTALLVGSNLGSVTYSSASAALSVALFPGSGMVQSVWGAVAAIVILYFGEFSPKLLCAARPLRSLLTLAPVWEVFAKVFAPVGAVIQSFIGRFIPKRETRIALTPDAVLKILEDRKDGVKLSDIESALIGRILTLRAKGEFLVPESLLSALDEGVV